MRLRQSRGDDRTMSRGVSGQKFTGGSVDPVLSIPLQNFLESDFSRGWREKPLVAMTAGQLDRFFDELIALVRVEGVEN